MGQQARVAAAVGMVVLGACASVQKFDNRVFELQKVALVSFYGPAEVPVPHFLVMQHAANSKDVRKQAPSVAVKAERLLRQRLEKTLKLKVLDPARMVDMKAYKALNRADDAEDWVAPNSLKVLPMGKKHDAALGELATALKVDAVMVARCKWELEGEEGERETTMHGYAWTDIIVVDRDGARLLDDGFTGRSSDLRWFTEKKSFADIGVGLFGTGQEPKMLEAVHEAVEASLDRFTDAWMEAASSHASARARSKKRAGD